MPRAAGVFFAADRFFRAGFLRSLFLVLLGLSDVLFLGHARMLSLEALARNCVVIEAQNKRFLPGRNGSPKNATKYPFCCLFPFSGTRPQGFSAPSGSLCLIRNVAFQRKTVLGVTNAWRINIVFAGT